MRRLFWKFFTYIWLSMAGSIAVLFAFTALFQVTPFTTEVERGQKVFALDVASRLLASEGAEVASVFATEAAGVLAPVKLTIARTENPGDCPAIASKDERYVKSAGDCYRVALPSQTTGFVSEFWPKLVPWISALLAAAIAAYWLARSLIRPVAYLRSGLSALAGGRFDIRIGDKMEGRRDEVAALAHDFDASAARLEELQSAQQRLFHDVSHELRSPLSRLQAAIGVLQQNPGKLGSMMDRMVREVERIDELIEEILTLARLSDRSQDPTELQTLDVVDLLNDIVADAAFEGQSREIRVLHEGTQSFVAEVNGELIYRALENVIRNALKYTPDHSVISIRSEVTAESLWILVGDQGPGVPPSDLDRIFEPFARGDGGVVLGGHGLGLAIAKQAILRHGGQVAASIAEQGGLTVSLQIPRTNRPSRQSRPGVAAQGSDKF